MRNNTLDTKLHRGIIDGSIVEIEGKDCNGFISEVVEYAENDPRFIAIYEESEQRDAVKNAYEFLENTDYVACKIAEGSATIEEYAEVIAQRRQARDIINTYGDLENSQAYKQKFQLFK